MILFDSPGFDDTYRADIDLLKMIGIHLQQGAKENKFLTGVIYIQNITDKRMSGSALKQLRLLRQLCGADHYAHIALVTSHWDRVGAAEGEAREKQLCTDFWADMIEKGAKVCRHTNTKESAIEILKLFLPESSFELLFQKEFNAHGNVGDTAAGREIVQILTRELGECRAEILRLTEENKKAIDENERMRRDIQTLRDDINRLKLESDRERQRERDRRRDIQQTLGLKQKLIDKANSEREKVEGEIAGLRAEIDTLKLEKEKENSQKEELKSKQMLIDQANAARETVEGEIAKLKAAVDELKLGKSKEEHDLTAEVARLNLEIEKQNTVKEELKSKEELDLIAEVARLNLEIEKQNTVKEDLKSKERLLKEAEAAKEKAEKEKEQAEKESRRLREEMEKLPRDQELENAFKAGRDAKTRRIRDIEEENRKKDGKIQENTKQVEESREFEASMTEAMTLVKQPATAPPPRAWPALPFCANQ
jgi:hypothetical protein